MKKENNKEAKLQKIRHSLSHLLAAAVIEKYPATKLGIGPVIENGFYYDFDFEKSISENDLAELESRVRELAEKNLVFTKKNVTYTEAKKLFKSAPYKLELIKELKKKKEPLTVYITESKANRSKSAGCGSSVVSCFVDLCAGPHVKNTSEINPDAFALTKIAGAYWRGNEKNKMLTRIYGLAFETKRELEKYQNILTEAERRDHKKLGPELDLFTFSELVGSGLPLWTPKGTLIRNILDNFVWELRKKEGYEMVDIPHISKKDLYEKSGHWQKFKDELFKIETREGHLFAIKPMNCPQHTQIYARKKWSYRELPQRYATTTKVYRDEQSGELAGLSRVRAITQDDAHVFCRKSQIHEEMGKIWDIIRTFYGAFGFSLSVRLSLSDPKQMEKYLGSPKLWKIAENELRALIKDKKASANEAKGEAAFYGPKIDFMANDSLGREWQVATIQLDMNMPERFDLTCVNEEGKPERIVMLHAAIMGSIERFLSILIEHYAGAFPLWLSPVQINILPVSEKFTAYAGEIRNKLFAAGIRAEINGSGETLGKRIRDAELQKIPYILVVGEKEKSTKTVNFRRKGGKETGTISADEFVSKIEKEIAGKK